MPRGENSKGEIMKTRKILYILFSVLVIASFLLGGSAPVQAQNPGPGNNNGQGQDKEKITHNDRQEAAARALQEGALNPLMVTMAAVGDENLIDGAPHYFSHPNYANSPLPIIEGATIFAGNPLVERAYASDFPVG
jgi:hypothetical protein